MKARLPLLLTLLTVLLTGCLGSNSDSDSTSSTQSTVRLVNASSDYAQLTLNSSGTALASGIAFGSASTYSTVTSGSTSFTVQANGSSSTVAQSTVTLTASVDYTMIAVTTGQQLQLVQMTDNEAAPASGSTKLRISNLSQEAGSVDIYVTEVGIESSSAAPLTTYVTGTTGYLTMNKGTYHIWVTGAGDSTDIRLDIPSVTLSDQQIATLLLTSASGGGLVDGFFVTQKGEVSSQKNASARLRLVANINGNGSVDATANGVSLASNQRSPIVGSYFIVPAGALSMTVLVNGSPVSAGNLNAPVGADLTLLVLGGPVAPQFFLLSDNNKKPVGNNVSKLRLVNGINNLGDRLSLTTDYSPTASNVAFGAMSAPATVNNTISRLEVNSTQANESLYLTTDVKLQSSGIYSLFMLGSAATPIGILRRDR
ncbi:MAG: DUF4397 domain-containing protein [Sterolibacterium sp.]